MSIQFKKTKMFWNLKINNYYFSHALKNTNNLYLNVDKLNKVK